jgi:hypothetical protein
MSAHAKRAPAGTTLPAVKIMAVITLNMPDVPRWHWRRQHGWRRLFTIDPIERASIKIGIVRAQPNSESGLERHKCQRSNSSES